jgi:hypothetical protein
MCLDNNASVIASLSADLSVLVEKLEVLCEGLEDCSLELEDEPESGNSAPLTLDLLEEGVDRMEFDEAGPFLGLRLYWPSDSQPAELGMENALDIWCLWVSSHCLEELSDGERLRCFVVQMVSGSERWFDVAIELPSIPSRTEFAKLCTECWERVAGVTSRGSGVLCADLGEWFEVLMGLTGPEDRLEGLQSC